MDSDARVVDRRRREDGLSRNGCEPPFTVMPFPDLAAFGSLGGIVATWASARASTAQLLRVLCSLVKRWEMAVHEGSGVANILRRSTRGCGGSQPSRRSASSWGDSRHAIETPRCHRVCRRCAGRGSAQVVRRMTPLAVASE
jgi:hypothetical protein